MTPSETEKKVTPFTFVTAILEDGRSLLTERPDYLSSYSPFVINRALSYHADTVQPAQWMNERPDIDKLHHEAFLINICRRGKRPFKKWAKTTSDDVRIEAVQEYFDCSKREALMYLELLTTEQMEEISSYLERGGKGKVSTRKRQ